MKLARLRLTNFRQHAESNIEFDTGLTGIIGPNGAGKSTILEAIAWALYGGNTVRGGNESLRFNRAAARAPVRVELEFDLAGHRYRVVRGLSMAELYLDGGEVAIANSVTTVAEMLQRRLGMTRTEFFNTYFTGTEGTRGDAVDGAVGAGAVPVAGAGLREAARGTGTLRCAAEGTRERDRRPACRDARPRRDRRRRSGRRARPSPPPPHRRPRRSGSSARPSSHWSPWRRDGSRQPDGTRRAAADRDRARRGGWRVAGDHARRGPDRETELAQVTEARAALTPLLPDVDAFARAQAELEALRALAVQDGRRRALLETQAALDGEVRRRSTSSATRLATVRRSSRRR